MEQAAAGDQCSSGAVSHSNNSSASTEDTHSKSDMYIIETDDAGKNAASSSLDDSGGNSSNNSLLIQVSGSTRADPCSAMTSTEQLSEYSDSLPHHVMPYQLRRKSPGLRLKSPSISPSIDSSKLLTNLTVSPSVCIESLFEQSSLHISPDEESSVVKIYPAVAGSSSSLPLEDLPQCSAKSSSFSVCSPTLAGSGGMAINNPPNPPIPNTPSTPGPSQQMIPPTMLPINLNDSPRTNSGIFNGSNTNNSGLASNYIGGHTIHTSSNSASNSVPNSNVNGSNSITLSSRQLEDILPSVSSNRLPANYATNFSLSTSNPLSHQSLSILSVSSISSASYLGALPTLSLSTLSASSSLSQQQHLTITSATNTRATIATPSTSAAAPSSPSSLPSSSFVSVSSLSPSMLPARKRPRRSYSTSDGASAGKMPVIIALICIILMYLFIFLLFISMVGQFRKLIYHLSNSNFSF